MTDERWLPNGEKVKLLEETEHGFVIFRDGFFSQMDDEWIGGGPELVSVVLSAPPVRQKEAEVERLDKLIEERRTQLEHLQTQIHELNAAYKEAFERANKFKNFRHLERLEDFLDGKITHFVYVNEDGVFNITEAKDEKSQHGSWDKLRLLSLKGTIVSGKVKWVLSTYSDGGGGDTNVVPCSSYEEALEVAKEKIFFLLDNANNSWRLSESIKNAEAHNIEVPDKYYEKLYELERKSAENSIATALETLAKKKEALEKITFKKPLTSK